MSGEKILVLFTEWFSSRPIFKSPRIARDPSFQKWKRASKKGAWTAFLSALRKWINVPRNVHAETMFTQHPPTSILLNFILVLKI